MEEVPQVVTPLLSADARPPSTPATPTPKASREDRQHGSGATDQRASPFEHDRDRLLYSDAFRRLTGVTQVVSATDGRVYHNRLTHTMKVAQLARRIAEMLLREQAAEAEALGGLSPEVAEAAALGHDIGHPPFGHVAEETLAKLVTSAGNDDGYEGNAQAFRIVGTMEFQKPGNAGLNLTRATLNGLLKYPWCKKPDGKGNRKYGYYMSSESETFSFARALSSAAPEARSCEAEIMDWADDITFSVHDLEDFYRAGLVPLDRLVHKDEEMDWFFGDVERRWTAQGRTLDDAHKNAFVGLLALFPRAPFRDSDDERAKLRILRSMLIRRYVTGEEDAGRSIRLDASDPDGRAVTIPAGLVHEVTMLKELTWAYVIDRPALATQQWGHVRIVRDLFEYFFDAARSSDQRRVPSRFAARIGDRMDDHSAARFASDVVSSLTDIEALQLARRILGVEPGEHHSLLQV